LGLDNSWNSKTTKNTSLFLENLLQNEEYSVRVLAETRAGVGNPSDLIFVRIFVKKPSLTEPPDPKDGPPTESENLLPQQSPQHLGNSTSDSFN